MKHPALAIVLCIAAAVQAHAANLPARGVFYYSDECFQEQSGDAGGGTLKVTRTSDGDTVEYGWAGEGPMDVLNTIDVHIDLDGKIRFTIPPTPGTYFENVPHYFSGTISNSEVRLQMTGVGAYSVMPRQKLSYKPKVCR